MSADPIQLTTRGGRLDRIGRIARMGRVGPSLGGAARWFAFGAAVALVRVAGTAATPADVVPLLVAAGAACVVGLTLRRAPSVAWLAATAGSFAAAALPIRLASGADPAAVGVATWLGWALPAGVVALTTLWIAAGYATRPEARLEPAPLVAAAVVGWFAIALAVTVLAVLAGQREDPAFTWVDVATVPIAWFRPLLALVVALGAVADVRDAVHRARHRSAEAASPWELGVATVRELVPGQVEAEESRARAERRDLAGDLHATVVPSLRRAIEEAEDGGDPAAVLRHLRLADLELERLMADRWPIVLETFGLVAALEDLAERLETDGAPAIALEIERADGRPARDIERAAWRFAQVTLDNAIRHGRAGAIEVRVAVGADGCRLVVADDGAGFDVEASPRRRSRGLADVRETASGVGATVALDSSPQGGTIASFTWPSP